MNDTTDEVSINRCYYETTMPTVEGDIVRLRAFRFYPLRTVKGGTYGFIIRTAKGVVWPIFGTRAYRRARFYPTETRHDTHV
jgi:hypothetical protein